MGLINYLFLFLFLFLFDFVLYSLLEWNWISDDNYC